MNGFKFEFSKIFWGGAHRAPPQAPPPAMSRASPSILGRFAPSFVHPKYIPLDEKFVLPNGIVWIRPWNEESLHTRHVIRHFCHTSSDTPSVTRHPIRYPSHPSHVIRHVIPHSQICNSHELKSECHSICRYCPLSMFQKSYPISDHWPKCLSFPKSSLSNITIIKKTVRLACNASPSRTTLMHGTMISTIYFDLFLTWIPSSKFSIICSPQHSYYLILAMDRGEVTPP